MLYCQVRTLSLENWAAGFFRGLVVAGGRISFLWKDQKMGLGVTADALYGVRGQALLMVLGFS
jgi:hypothetical protein